MSCDKCVSKVKPEFERAGLDRELKFDMSSTDKTVAFRGTEVQKDEALNILKSLGYSAAERARTQEPQKIAFFETYRPLLLIATFLVGIVTLIELKSSAFDFMRAMNHFMGGFFIVFSFFKFLDVSKFADAFSTYDVIGKRSRIYSLAYPFIELALGIGFLSGALPFAVNILTVVPMIVGNLGVWQAIRKQQVIQCACLGTVFDLPMTEVTLFENSLMFVMAAATLARL